MSLERSGADYLRNLKADQERGLPSPTQRSHSSGAAAIPVPVASSTRTERRQSPRYRCQGSAEFRVGGTDVRTWGTFTDLSLQGCYIEMTATFPVGATVDLALELKGRSARVQGEVRVSYPFLGIGVVFRDVSPENREVLQEMVRSLLPDSRIATPEAPAEVPPSSHQSLPVIVNPVAAMQALVDFFENRTLLSKDDFLQLVRKSQTPHR